MARDKQFLSQKTTHKKLKNSKNNPIIFLIRVYQYLFNPVLGSCCRFYPSCSRYFEEAIHERGLFFAIGLTLWRLLKCHPFNPGGYDPVPKGKTK